MATTGSDTLSWFEVPRPFIEPMLRALKLGNTALDALFYDVNTVAEDLLSHGSIVVTGEASTGPSTISVMTKAFSNLDLSALSNPEGSGGCGVSRQSGGRLWSIGSTPRQCWSSDLHPSAGTAPFFNSTTPYPASLD